MLRLSMDDLNRIEAQADGLYREIVKLKKDGSPRFCYDALPELKRVHGRIKCLVLKKVVYPAYLTGGLPGRDYIENAQLHAGKPRIMVNDDISDFFPSTSVALVFDTWRYFFHMPLDVTRCLTRLTTRQGGLPQGAKTSSYLANLGFWAHEPRLVAQLRALGFVYSRYIDDITISTPRDCTPAQLGHAVGLVSAMVKRYGLRFNRQKHRLTRAGQRMEVTGLIVSDGGAGMRRARHSAMRAAVHRYEIAVRQPGSVEAQSLKSLAATVLGQYGRLHPKRARVLKQRLRSADGSGQTESGLR